MGAKLNQKNILKFLGDNAIIILLLGLVIFVSITKMNFFSLDNFLNISVNTSVRFIIALGVSGTLITRGTDLSAGRMVGLGGVVACTLLQRADYVDRFFPSLPQLPVVVVLIFIIALCAVIGLLNGVVVAFLKVPPFLATLGMQTIVYGANLVYSKATPIGGLRGDFTVWASGSLKSIPGLEGFYYLKYISFLLLFAIAAGILMSFLYNKTRYGKYMYAIGGNENAAEVSGVNVTRSKLKIYTLAGALYGLGGFLLAAKSGGASVGLGGGYELEAIAACTIGGVSTTGGVGKVGGILLGVLVFELMKTSLQFLGVDTSLQYVAQGLVIIIAVALDLRKYNAKK